MSDINDNQDDTDIITRSSKRKTNIEFSESFNENNFKKIVLNNLQSDLLSRQVKKKLDNDTYIRILEDKIIKCDCLFKSNKMSELDIEKNYFKIGIYSYLITNIEENIKNKNFDFNEFITQEINLTNNNISLKIKKRKTNKNKNDNIDDFIVDDNYIDNDESDYIDDEFEETDDEYEETEDEFEETEDEETDDLDNYSDMDYIIDQLHIDRNKLDDLDFEYLKFVVSRGDNTNDLKYFMKQSDEKKKNIN